MTATSLQPLELALLALERQRALIGGKRSSSASRIERFINEAKAVIAGGFVRYSQRLQLLDLARQLRIPEFEATLILAALQNRAEQQPNSSTPPRGQSISIATTAEIDQTIDDLFMPALNWPWTAMLVTVSQLLIVTAVWWLMRGLL